jgi:hypothetical protein
VTFWTASRRTSLHDAIELASCIERVLPDLPLNPAQKCASFSHHYDARTGKWNEGIRFNPLPTNHNLDSITAVHYLGGSTAAADVVGLQKMLPGRPIHVAEPVPLFFSSLVAKYAGVAGIILHNVGLANASREVRVPTAALNGQSTVLMGGNTTSGATDTVKLSLLGPLDFLSQTGFDIKRDKALLHVNCEGCEYEMMEGLIDHGLLHIYPIIQFSFHYVPEVHHKVTRYCSIRLSLEKTHTAVVSLPWGWERFIAHHMLQ